METIFVLKVSRHIFALVMKNKIIQKSTDLFLKLGFIRILKTKRLLLRNVPVMYFTILLQVLMKFAR